MRSYVASDLLRVKGRMALSDGVVHFLPDDLRASNRLFFLVLAGLLKRSASP